MWPYWILFLVPAFGAFARFRLDQRSQAIVWWTAILFFSLMIGFRDRVGGDWAHYLEHFELVSYGSFASALGYGDPGYYGLGWIIAQLGGSIYELNFCCALILMVGIGVFARRQPMPWLALLVAVPYLIIVVAMGYTRQSVALGFALIALAALEEGKAARFVVWVLIGALFHKTAVLLLPIAALAASKHRLWNLIWVAVVSVTGAALLLSGSGDALWNNYVQADMQSSGGAIRVAMNVLPAALFIVFNRRLELGASERKLWFWISLLSLGCLPLVALASTAVDRVALYFIPVQMFAFSHLLQLPRRRMTRTNLLNATVIYYAAVQFTWLNYATFAKYWVPYHFMPL
jgi:hypothetical protein